MNRERVIAMVRKLVELAEGTPYEHEAASAMAKAEELLRRHGLAMAQCRAEPQGCTARERNTGFRRVPKWMANLHAGIGRVFDCCSLSSRHWNLERNCLETHLAFIGEQQDAELAEFLFEMARKVVNAHLKATKVEQKAKRDYAIGVSHGVELQIQAMRPASPTQEEAGIVLHKLAEVSKYLKERFDMRWDGPRYGKADYDPVIVASGAKVGQELQLTMGLKDDGLEPLALGQAPLALEGSPV